MTSKTYLIVNADDFGLSSGVNRGIIKAHEHGIVTSTSLMVRWPAVAEAAAYSRKHPEFSVGLHIDLGEWACRNWEWFPLYEVVPAGDNAAAEAEVFRQMDAFRRLVGRNPTHIDSHQHVHREEPMRSVLIQIADDLGVPLRHFGPEIHYCGDFYGQTAEGLPLLDAISVDRLIQIISELPTGYTELACHPAEGSDLETMYRYERKRELEALCDPRVRAAIAAMKIELRSFGSIHAESE